MQWHFGMASLIMTPSDRSKALFTTQGRFFLRRELLRGTTIAAKIGQALVDLKLKVVRTHNHFHDRGSITQSAALESNALPC